MSRRKDQAGRPKGSDTLSLVDGAKPFPPAPKGLDATGRAAWRRGKSLWQAGQMQEKHLRAWETYCRAVQEVRHCNDVTKREGEYHVQANGAVCQHPAIKRRMSAEDRMFRYEEVFGLVPTKKDTETKKKPSIATRRRTG